MKLRVASGQSSNAPPAMCFMLAGMVIVVKAGHEANARTPMLSTPFPRFTSARFEQFANACKPTASTLPGMSMEVRAWHP